jgi:hypothetical protein
MLILVWRYEKIPGCLILEGAITKGPDVSQNEVLNLRGDLNFIPVEAIQARGHRVNTLRELESTVLLPVEEHGTK